MLCALLKVEGYISGIKKKKDWSLLPKYSHSRGSITKLIKMRQKSVPGKENAFIKMQR